MKRNVRKLDTTSKYMKNLPKWKPKEGRHERAVIYNFSGHPVPDSVFAGLDGVEPRQGLRQRGHKFWYIYTGIPGYFDHLCLPDQITAYLYDVQNKPNKDGCKAFEAEGDKYILLPHVGEVSLLMGLAIKALGFDLTLITVKEHRDGTYQVGDFIDLDEWFHYWRTEGRNDLLLTPTACGVC